MDTQVPDISVASEDERERVLATVLLAFGSDPLLRWFFPSAGSYIKGQKAVNAFCGRAIDHGAAYRTENFEAVALWLPPGVEPDEEVLIAELERNVPPDRFEQALGIFESMEQYHPHEPCWYLPVIGVDLPYQGRGLGSALMKHALRRCDSEKRVAYLESSNPKNIPLYERHGFSVIGEIQVGMSPTIYPMLREARK